MSSGEGLRKIARLLVIISVNTFKKIDEQVLSRNNGDNFISVKM
jgi:hypothetical protein